MDMTIADPPLHSDYTEPWHIRYLGGLTVALHKLLPFSGGYMYLDFSPDTPSNKIIRSRSYTPADKVCFKALTFYLSFCILDRIA